MGHLFTYNNDGQQAAARAVLAILQGNEAIEPSWNGDTKKYDAEPHVVPWFNGRERGYIIYMKPQSVYIQLNIAFYEHRNSDNICAIAWIGRPDINPPNLQDEDLQSFWESKYDLSLSVSYNQHYDMAQWIKELLEDFWQRPEFYQENYKNKFIRK